MKRTSLPILTVILTTSVTFPIELPEFQFKVDDGTSYRIELPNEVLKSMAYKEIRWFEDKEKPQGILVDLNEDGYRDFIVRGSKQNCGTGGCPFNIFDGQTNKDLGWVGGMPILIGQTVINGFPVISAYWHASAEEGSYSVYVFNGQKYVIVWSVNLSGDSLKRLSETWKKVPEFKKSQQK